MGKEKRCLDYKSDFRPSEPGGWQEIIKDIVAISNAGGGHIVVGATSEGKPSGVTLNEMQLLDQAHYVDQISKYTSAPFGELEVDFHKVDKKEIAIISIAASLPPKIFIKEGHFRTSNGKDCRAFQAGVIYTRHGSKSEPANQSDVFRWFDTHFRRMKSDLLRNVKKAVTLPRGYTIAAVPRGYKITNDPDAAPVRLTNDPNAPEIAYRAKLDTAQYTSLQEELIGAVKAWKTDEHAYTPRTLLWRFYANRDSLTFDSEMLECLFLSSMHNHCPFYYWASRVGRVPLLKILQSEARKDEHPANHCIVRLGFALGGGDGLRILQFLKDNSTYRSVKSLSSRLIAQLAKEKTVWNEHGSPMIFSVMIGPQSVKVDVGSLRSDPKAFAKTITALASQSKTRSIAKRLDALLYGQM